MLTLRDEKSENIEWLLVEARRGSEAFFFEASG